ncbi:MAG: thioredoxin fold domain-containing protein [Candidatus Hodarchaeales archaeon]
MTLKLYQPIKQNFEISLKEKKPVILIFSDEFCEFCSTFKENVLKNELVSKAIKEHFMPMILNVNQYPEFLDRFTMPSRFNIHEIFGLDRTILGTCVDSNDKSFLRNLEKYYSYYDPEPNFDYHYGSSFTEPLLEDYKEFHKKINLIAEITLSCILKSYDKMFGGWHIGDGTFKTHFFSPIEYLILLYHRTCDSRFFEMIIKTLDAVTNGLYDLKNGGFYDFSNSRDWSIIGTYQKSLPLNTEIALNFLHMFQMTKAYKFLDLLKESLDFIVNNYYSEELTQQDDTIKYSKSFLTDSNCKVISLLLESKLSLEEQKFVPKIKASIDKLRTMKTDFGLPHSLSILVPNQYLLRDQSAYMSLLLKAYSYSGDISLLDESEKMLNMINSYYFDSNLNLFQDRLKTPEDFGPLKRSIYPIIENSLMIDNLITLSYFTNNKSYKELARRVVTSYYKNFGISRKSPFSPEFVISNQRLVESPIELLILGDLEKDSDVIERMLNEMKRIYDPFKIIQILDVNRDVELIHNKHPNLKVFDKATAYVKVDDTLSKPSFFPKDIALILDTLIKAIKYTFE